MAEASTTTPAFTEDRDTEEMDNQELLQILRADLGAAEARSDKRFDELKAEISAAKQELRADIKDAKQEVMAYVDKRIDAVNQRIDETAKAVNRRIDETAKAVNQRIDDLRDSIEANRLFKNNWRTFVVATLATAAVIGTFVLQLMEAIV